MELLNKTQRKYRFVFVLIVAAFTMAGCKNDFLDRELQGQYTLDNYPFPAGAGPYDQFIFAAYSELRSFNVHSQSFIAITSIRSDDADKGSSPADGPPTKEMDDFQITVSNGLANTMWIGYFSLVNKANIVLDQIENNEEIVATQEIKDQSAAEARFIRAYAYFMLVRVYGGVPLIDRIFDDPAAQSNIPRSTAAQIYALIESDLEFAKDHLPLSWDPRFFTGRITSGAANGLLAKVYLTQQKWSQAFAAANRVITSGQYDLSTPYAKIFRGEEGVAFAGLAPALRADGENSRESVFEIQATASRLVPTANGVQYAQIQGVRSSGIWNLGWGFNTPSVSLENAYEPGDPRKARTILYMSTPTQKNFSIYGEETPVFTGTGTAPWNPRYNHKTHTHPVMRSDVNNMFGWWMNVRILRYADVVLMYAEAANELENTPEALEKLEMVRARARAGNNTILPPVTTTNQEALRQAIRLERRVELAMEHDRFFDIVRWGIAPQALAAHGKTFVAGRDELLPIPQNQIDLSKGVLTQNPGY